MQQMHAQRHGGAQRGQAAARSQHAGMSQRQRTPGRSNSFDDLHHFRSAAVNSAPAAQKQQYAAGPRNQHPPQPAADAPAAGRAGPSSQAAPQLNGATAGPASNGGPGKAGPDTSAAVGSGSSPEGSALQFDSPQTPTGQPRPPGMFEAIPSPSSSPGPQTPEPQTPALHVRTIADAVREGPVAQRAPQQAQPTQQPQSQTQRQSQAEGGLLSPGRTQPLVAPYSSAVLGLGRPQRPQMQNGPAASARAGPPAAASSAASVAASAAVAPAGHAHAKTPAGAASNNSHPWGRQRAEGQSSDAAQHGRDRDANTQEHQAPPTAAAAAPPQPQPKFQPEPPPARFTLDNEAEFPQLGAVKTKRRQNGPFREPPSPPGSIVGTPCADSTSPVCTPAAGKGAVNVSQSVGSSPASGWGNRPDARVALTSLFDPAGASSKSEGSSPTAAAARGGAWATGQQQQQHGQASQAAWTGAAAKAALSNSARGMSPRAKR